jgi:peptidyl-prolyl cis-trans isomerase D
MDPVFEEAAFLLSAAGDFSSVVKSDFGYHIIKLIDVKPETTTAFEDVKEDITASVKTFKAEEEFYAIQQRIAEVAFEVPDDLNEVAELAGSAITTTELFTRNNAPQVLSTPTILADAFSVELIEDRVNSEVLELGSNHIMVIRVAEHEPERTKSIDEVTEQIQQTLSAQGAQQAANDWAVELQSALAKGEDVTEKLEALELSWAEQKGVTRNESTLSQSIVEALFKLAEKDSSVVDLITGDVSLVQLIQVNQAAEADDTQLTSLQSRLASSKSQSLYGAVVESLKSQADITIY